MKSIYDEALGDLNWLMSDEFDDVQRYPKLNFQQRLDMFIGVRNTFEQARKQEKLLELYEELAAVKDDLLSCCEVRDLDYFDIIDIQSDLEQQIVEVEK